jgi:hypothetical protein
LCYAFVFVDCFIIAETQSFQEVEDDGYDKYTDECEEHHMQPLSYQEWLEQGHHDLLVQLKCEMNGDDHPSSCAVDTLDRVCTNQPAPRVLVLKPGPGGGSRGGWFYEEDIRGRIWCSNRALGVDDTLDPGAEHWVETAVALADLPPADAVKVVALDTFSKEHSVVRFVGPLLPDALLVSVVA